MSECLKHVNVRELALKESIHGYLQLVGFFLLLIPFAIVGNLSLLLHLEETRR